MVHHSTATAAPCLAPSAQDGLKCTIPPLPLQDTTQQASCPGLLVCPLPPRVGGAIDSVEPSSQAENNLGSGTHEHPTPHYIHLLIPLETANVCVFIVPNINFSYPCEDGEVESTHTSGDRSEDGETECSHLYLHNSFSLYTHTHTTIRLLY